MGKIFSITTVILSLTLLVMFIPNNVIHAELPEYCSDVNGSIVCEITILPYSQPGSYSSVYPENSAVNHNTAQLHLVYHTAPAPEMTNNFPPPLEVFEHAMFYDIDVLPLSVKPVQLKESKVEHDDTVIPQKDSHTDSDDNVEEELSKMSPKAQMIQQSIDPSDVRCKHGFDLVIKNSNGSAACINSHSIEKLIQRGWVSIF